MIKHNISRDIKSLTYEVKKLKKVPLKHLDNAVCDIIDIGGYSLAVLLDRMHLLSAKRQKHVARKIEDFLYFHPLNGKKLLSRMRKTLNKIDKTCVPHIFAAMIDVAEKLPEGKEKLADLSGKAVEILSSDIDLPRKTKAIEIIAQAKDVKGIPLIISSMTKNLHKLDNYANYHFVETALLALKRIGGDALLRLLVNPNSADALKQIRMEWRQTDDADLKNSITALKKLDENFAQVMLKVIDLSEFNLPFIAMIKEGLNHTDKWVRQASAASMQKVGENLNVEMVKRMLNDPASEVRLMAVSSLGGFSTDLTGDLLKSLAFRESETVGIRMNALYALYAQKNIEALKELQESDNKKVALNAKGLAAMLMNKEEGLKILLKALPEQKSEHTEEFSYYIIELTEPEDLKTLIETHNKSKNATHKERYRELIRAFINKKEGPRLKSAIENLTESEQKAVKLLKEGINLV